MKLQKHFAVLAITAVLAASSARAQEQPPQNGSQPADSTQPVSPLPPQENDAGDRQTPAPAARGLFLSGNPQDETGQIQPDTHPLSGALTPGLGTAVRARRLFDPAFRLGEAVDSGFGQANSVTSLGGNIAYARDWKLYRLIAAYNGSQTFYEPDSSLSQSYHNVSLSQEAHWRRWGLLLRDDLIVSPEASFGGLYAGIPGFSVQNSVLTGITPALQTPETILTGRSRRLNNTALAEIDYSLSRRTTFTFSGSYSLLHFSNAGFLSNRSINTSAGLDYALSPKNTIALVYAYSSIRYTIGGGLETHLAQLAFGRKITERLSLQLAGGPQLLRFRNSPLSGTRRWSWSVTGSLNYRRTRNTAYNLSYFHGITAGSGVYLGATSDTLGGAVDHKFTRLWSGSLNTGYARNTNLTPVIGISLRYDNWYAGGNLAHQMGRQIFIVGSYAYQRQYSAAGACPVLSCALSSGGGRNIVSISLEWHPFAIQTE